MGLLAALVVLLCIYTPARAAEGCSGFRHLENGRTFFRYSGLLVIFRCRPGYKLCGYKTNSCVSGHWSRDPPVCVGSGCSNPGPLTHGTSGMNEDGSWAAFSCNSGFRLHGPSMLYCKGHSWNTTTPVCKEFDMMTAASGVSVQKANINQKTQQQSHYDAVANTPSKEAHLKFGSSPRAPSQMSNSERIKVTDPKVRLQQQQQQQQHIEFPGFRVKGWERAAPREARLLEADDAQGLETGTVRHGTEAEAPDGKSKKVDQDTERFSSELHPFTTISSTSSLVSATGRPISSPPVRLGRPILTQDHVTPSEVITGPSKTADGDHQAATGVQYPSTSRPGSVDKEEPMETSTSPSVHSISNTSSSPTSSTLSLSSPPPSSSASTSSSRPISATQSNTPNVTLPSNASIPRGASSHWADDLATDSTPPPPPPPPLLPSRRPVCPYPPVPVHGTFFFRNVENPGPRAYRHYIQYTCYPGYTLARGDVHSYCQQGGTWSGITPLCLESTPCSVNNGGCSQLCSHSQRYNQSSNNQTQVGTRCHCRPGFTLLDDGQTCRDVDECAVNRGLGPCVERCHNSPGSYRCSCTYGHILAGDGHGCVPECPPGYRKQPATPENSTAQALKEECEDINECQEEESVCEWQCVNLPGSHRCICPRGYTLQRDGQRCKDINECRRRNGGCSHLCVNIKGGYKCVCPASHRLSPYSWKKCVPRKTAHPAG